MTSSEGVIPGGPSIPASMRNQPPPSTGEGVTGMGSLTTPENYHNQIEGASTKGVALRADAIAKNNSIPEDNIGKKLLRAAGYFFAAIGIILGVTLAIAAIAVGIYLALHGGAVGAGLVIGLGCLLFSIPSLLVGKIGIGLMMWGDKEKLEKENHEWWDNAVNWCTAWPWLLLGGMCKSGGCFF